MKMMNLAQIYDNDFNLQNIAVFNVKSPHKKISTTLSEDGRLKQGFVYVCKNKYIYTPLHGEKIQVVAGDIIYLPQYSRYSHMSYSNDQDNENASCIVVNFDMHSTDGELMMLSNDLFKITPKDKVIYQTIFESLSAAYSINIHSNAKVKSILYSLFYELCNKFKYNDCNALMKDYLPIRSAIQYIEQNNTMSRSIKELADMCFMSENTFRKLFKLYAGMLPSDYINKLKMEKAKFYLKDHMLSVSETAQILEFTDVSYFSRVFKKYTGQMPSKYK